MTPLLPESQLVLLAPGQASNRKTSSWKRSNGFIQKISNWNGRLMPPHRTILLELEFRWLLLVAQTVKRLPAIQETRFDPWVGKIPWKRQWQPTPVLLPRKSHGWRSLVGYSPWGREQSDTTERLWLSLYYWKVREWSQTLPGSHHPQKGYVNFFLQAFTSGCGQDVSCELNTGILA